MPARAATPFDMRRISALLESALRTREGIVASALPAPLAGGAVGGWRALLSGLFGLGGRLRVYLEEYRGQLRSIALVYDGRRPEWVVLVLAALPELGGTDSAFRLLSGISAAAARSGMHRVFAAVPDEARPRETFFQAGFYSYTRETWYAAARAAVPAPSARMHARDANSVDAHDLFRFYAMTTPHAVQRAEQLSVKDFDHDQLQPRAIALAFAGLERHPNVLKVRTAAGDVDMARDLVRACVRALPASKAITSPVRSYEEHVARALLAEGFRDVATSMLFVKELAERVEEPALAPAVVR
jgi:hypothetical protein